MDKRCGRYRVRFYDSHGRRKSQTFQTKEDARSFLAKNEREKDLVRAGLEVPKDSTLVIDYTKKWLRKRFQSKTHGTASADAMRVTHYFLGDFGLRPAQSITSKEIREHLDQVQQKQGWKNATRNRLRAVLHTLFHDMFMDEVIVANPVTRAPLLPEKRVISEPITAQDITKLFATAKASAHPERNTLLLGILLIEGPRISEVVPLKHMDFDLNRDVLHIRRIYEASSHQIRDRRKGSPDGIEVPLFPSVKAAYLSYRATLKSIKPADFIFPSPNGKQPCWSTFTGRQVLYDLASVAKTAHVWPHLCRATFATSAEEAGFSKEELQRLMGHSTVLITERYTRGRIQHLVKRSKETGFGSLPTTNKVVPIRSDRTH